MHDVIDSQIPALAALGRTPHVITVAIGGNDILQYDRAAAHGLRPVVLHEALEGQGLRAMLNQYAADWFHPNDREHRVWADAFWQQMSAERGDQVRMPRPVAVLQESPSSSSRVNSGVREPRLQGE